MLEEIFKYISRLDIIDDSKNATPEWIEQWGRWKIEASGGQVTKPYTRRGQDIVKLLSDLELLLRGTFEPIELVITEE